MKAIRRNLKDQILSDDNKIMYCDICGGVFSANAGDYWDVPDNHHFICCGETMELGHFERRFIHAT